MSRNKTSNDQEEFQDHAFMQNLLKLNVNNLLVAGKPPTYPGNATSNQPLSKVSSLKTKFSWLEDLLKQINKVL